MQRARTYSLATLPNKRQVAFMSSTIHMICDGVLVAFIQVSKSISLQGFLPAQLLYLDRNIIVYHSHTSSERCQPMIQSWS